MRERISFIGLDVHKATIAVCVAKAGRDGEVRFVGEIPNEPAALDKLLAGVGRGGRTLQFIYKTEEKALNRRDPWARRWSG